MARLYFSFKTNLPDSSVDRCTPSVDYICIYDKEGEPRFSLSCSWESNYGITDGLYDASFKGVDIIKDGDFIEVEEADIKALRKMLQGGNKPEVEMQICLWGEEYPYLEEVLEVTDLKICLEAGDEKLEAELGKPTRVLVE